MIEDQLNNNALSLNDLKQRLMVLKEEQHQLVAERTRGAALRSRSMWYEEGDKSTKLFLNLEKSRGAKKQISSLKTKDNKLITNDKDILAEEVRYYQELYTTSLNPDTQNEDTLWKHIKSLERNMID